MKVIKDGINRYKVVEYVDYNYLKKVMRTRGVDPVPGLNYTFHDGDFVQNYINKYKNTGCIILSAYVEGKTVEENAERTEYLEELLKKQYDVGFQKVYGVYNYENGEVGREVSFFIPFNNIKKYELNDLRKIALECIQGKYKNEKGISTDQQSFFIIHPDYNDGKPTYINNEGKIASVLKQRECIFYFKENMCFANCRNKKWEYVDTEPEKGSRMYKAYKENTGF